MTKLQIRKIPKFQTSGKSPYKSLDINDIISIFSRGANSELKAPLKAYSVNPINKFGLYSLAGIDDRGLTKEQSELELKNKLFSNAKNEVEENEKNYKDMFGYNFPIHKEKNLGILASLIKPAIAAGSLAFNLQQLKKTRNAANQITSPRVDAATMPNRPIQGLSPDMVNLCLKNVAGLQTKKTSDATSNRLAEEMLNLNKLSALDKLSAAQIDNLFKEKDRHDKVDMMNAQESVKALNEQSKYNTDLQNKKAEINAGYESSKQDYINKWIDEALVKGITKPVEESIAYNMGKEAIEESEDYNRLQDRIVNTQNRLRFEPENTAIKQEYDELLKEQNQFSKRKGLPNYSDRWNYIFPNKNKQTKI